MASKNDDFFGGMFDFNGDGKTDLGEQFIAYKIFEEVTKEEDSDSDDSDDIGFSPRRTSTYRPTAQPVKTMPSAQPLPEHISFTDYKSSRRAFVGEIFLSLLVAAVLCFIPGIIVWAAISSYDAKNSASGFVVTVFVIVGLVIAGIILFAAASSISGSYKNLMKAKEIYLKGAAADELNQQKKAKKKRTIWICSILGAGLILLIVISSVNSSRLAADYSNAEMLISEGQYAEATAVLESIKEKDYNDTSALLLLCKAHTQYEAGRSVDAYYTMQDAQFRYQTEEQTAEITAFKSTLKQEYDDYISRMAERNRQEYEDRITNGVPYVGMSESRINDTSLGRPSDKVRHNYQVKNGEQYLANLYDFYQNGKCVFTARCVQGTVTEVWDNRDNPQTPYTPSGSGKKTYDTDPSVDGFSDPEDFYDWYWDDFFDYEDAEDYYYTTRRTFSRTGCQTGQKVNGKWKCAAFRYAAF